ncbi:MAG: YcjF family protein [Methylococcales bacterium]
MPNESEQASIGSRPDEANKTEHPDQGRLETTEHTDHADTPQQAGKPDSASRSEYARNPEPAEPKHARKSDHAAKREHAAKPDHAEKAEQAVKPERANEPQAPHKPKRVSEPEQPDDSRETTEPQDANKVEQARIVKANTLVTNYALSSIVIGAIPLPLVDLAALTGLLLTMLHSLCKLYGMEFSKQIGKSLIASLLAGGISLSLSSNLARVVRSLVKTIPVFGTATGMISVSLFGGASTYAIGKVFIKHFESGGTFLDFETEAVKEYYAKQFEEGKQELKKSATAKPQEPIRE